MRIGHGYDVHKLENGRKLILGGVDIPYEKGLLGHSDADVLVHAVMDALLGAAGLGDIGKAFPDTDPAYEGISSLRLLDMVMDLLRQAGLRVSNVRPRLSPYIQRMRENLAMHMDISAGRINVKATTEEGLGFTGAREGMAAHAVCLLEEL